MEGILLLLGTTGGDATGVEGWAAPQIKMNVLFATCAFSERDLFFNDRDSDVREYLSWPRHNFITWMYVPKHRAFL